MKERIAYSVERIAKERKGVILIITSIIMITLTAIVVAFLSLASIQTKVGGYDIVSHKALWLAEAGLQKAIWDLKTPVVSGGQGEDWTTIGVTESLGDGSYTMVVARWDLALAANAASASASSESGSYVAANAIDGSDSTYWESQNKPAHNKPEDIIIHFPYTLVINKVRFLVPAGSAQQAPKDYTWEVSSDGISYTTIVDVKNNDYTDRTDEFSSTTNVNYLKLSVTKVGGGSQGVRIVTLEAIGSKITSTGTVSVMNRKIAQTVVTDDATQTASNEIDWNEIFPSI